jgi:hypothetical protein
MSANEIPERCIASAWVRCPPDTGEGTNHLDQTGIRYRSQSGFQDVIYTCEQLENRPLLILPLAQVENRQQCQVFGNIITTVLEETNISYPDTPSTWPLLFPTFPALRLQPIRLAWMEPLTAPNWFPFGAPIFGTLELPELFDAIAVLLPGQPPVDEEPGYAFSGDFCVWVQKVPLYEGMTDLRPIIPNS